MKTVEKLRKMQWENDYGKHVVLTIQRLTDLRKTSDFGERYVFEKLVRVGTWDWDKEIDQEDINGWVNVECRAEPEELCTDGSRWQVSIYIYSSQGEIGEGHRSAKEWMTEEKARETCEKIAIEVLDEMEEFPMTVNGLWSFFGDYGFKHWGFSSMAKKLEL